MSEPKRVDELPSIAAAGGVKDDTKLYALSMNNGVPEADNAVETADLKAYMEKNLPVDRIVSTLAIMYLIPRTERFQGMIVLVSGDNHTRYKLIINPITATTNNTHWIKQSTVEDVQLGTWAEAQLILDNNLNTLI